MVLHLFVALIMIASSVSSSVSSATSTVTGVNFIPANDNRYWYAGRADSNYSFDWEGYSIHLNIVNSSFVQLIMNTTGPMTRVYTQVSVDGGKNYFDQTAVWVSPRTGTNTYWVADNLNSQVQYSVRITHDLEPAFSGSGGSPNSYFTFVGLNIDGNAVAPTPRTRRIEIVGDSISAGYGSRGSVNTSDNCPVMDFTSGVRGTYMDQLCEVFKADCSWIAWSGKGMFQNCCDSGETMPSYYLDTKGGDAYEHTWDFSKFSPDAIFINLGTNDFGHDSGPAWEANFTQTYIQFVLNATTRYNNPKLPVFVGQGPMNNGSPLYNSLQKAIQGINQAGGNAVYVDMRVPDGTDGCGGHPGLYGHSQMALMARPIIASTMGW